MNRTFTRIVPALALALAASVSAAPRRTERPRDARRPPPLPGHRDDAPERPPGHRRPDRLPEPRLAPDPGPDRLAQRGGARQVGLRPLLRAHDVPRDEGLPARRLPGDPDEGRRAAERLHDGRLHELPHDVRQGGPREGPRDRGGPLPEPRLPRGGVQDRVARRPRRVQQEQREPDVEALRGDARRAPSRRTPTSTRRWASSATSRTCPTSSPTRRRSSTAGTGRSTRRSSSRATSTRRRSSRSSRSTGAAGSAAATASTIPAEPPPTRPEDGPRPLDDADAPLGRRLLPRPRLLDHREGLGGPRRPPRPRLRPDVRRLQEARRDRAEGRPALPLPPRERRPAAPHGRARA